MSVFWFKISVAKTVEKQHPRIEKLCQMYMKSRTHSCCYLYLTWSQRSPQGYGVIK